MKDNVLCCGRTGAMSPMQRALRLLYEINRERGLEVDHSTVFRWVQRYAPEINKRIRPQLKLSGASYRIDETYVKVGKQWKYLYRAVDSSGDTIHLRSSVKSFLSRPIFGSVLQQR